MTAPTYKILHILECYVPHFSYTVTLIRVGIGPTLHSLLLIIYLAENILPDRSSEKYFLDNLTCSFCTAEGETGLSRANTEDGSKKMCSVETNTFSLSEPLKL